jgi:cell wall-associated NlpC family hydrolase
VISRRREGTSVAGPRLGLSRYSLAGAALGALLVVVGGVLVVLLSGSRQAAHASSKVTASSSRAGLRARESASAADPAAKGSVVSSARGLRRAQGLDSSAHAGALAGHSHAAKSGLGVVASAAAGGEVAIAEAPDPEESKSFPVPASVHHALASKPSKAAEEVVAPGAPSNSEVQAELKQMHAVQQTARKQETATLSTVPGGDSIGGDGQLPIPQGIPEVIQRVIAGANAITDFPYVYGGGHASFVSNSYDCSGSISYALAAGGLLGVPETSGQLESWGEPGSGKWITVYANAGHVYMYVNIGGRWMRYDTVGRSGTYASRWQPEVRSNAGFLARHWPGL